MLRFFPYHIFALAKQLIMIIPWQIIIRSSTKKHSTLYKLKVKYTSLANKVLQEKEIEAPFTMWFSSDGVFHPEPFRRWLASEIEILGLAAKETAKKTGDLSSHVGIDEQSTQAKGSKGGKKWNREMRA